MNWLKRLFAKKEVKPVLPVWKKEQVKKENKYRSSGSSYVGLHVAEDRRNDLLTDPLLSPLSPISPFSIWDNNSDSNHHQSTQDHTPSHSNDSHSHHDYGSSSGSDSTSYDSGSSSDSSSYDSGASSSSDW